MPNSKLIAEFRSRSEPAFMSHVSTVPRCQTDHQRLPEPRSERTPSLEKLRADEAAYREAQLALQNRDLRQLHKRHEARANLENDLRRVATYIELVANGDMGLLTSTGLDVRREPGRPFAHPASQAAAFARA